MDNHEEERGINSNNKKEIDRAGFPKSPVLGQIYRVGNKDYYYATLYNITGWHEVDSKSCKHQLISSSIDATTPCYKCVHCDEIFEAYANPLSSKRFAEEASRVLETDLSTTVTISPVINTVFNFSTALMVMKYGDRVSREAWCNENYSGSIIFFDGNDIKVEYPDNGGTDIYKASNRDILGIDWYIVK